MRKVWIYLYSTPNLVGTGLAMAGLLLFFFGIIKAYWAFIVVGLYIVGYMATPKPEIPELAIDANIDAKDLRRALDTLTDRIRGKVPDEIQKLVERIKESILDILPRLGKALRGESDGFVIQQTVLEYLPSTLEMYMRLPQAFARLHPVKDGKTPRAMLQEQLQLLDKEMKRIATDISETDSKALVAHGAFLKEKFGKSSIEWLQ